MIAATKVSLPLGRRLAGYGLAAAAAPFLTLVLASLRGQLDPTTDVLAFLLAVIAVALSGSLIPAVLEAVGGSLLIIFYFAPQRHPVTIAGANNAAVLGVFVAVALAVGLLARDVARRTRQAARAAAECDLLATAAASVLRGPEALAAVLDRAREVSGMDSVTLLERGPSAGNAAGRAVGWTPVAISGGPPITRPNDAAVTVSATGSLCLALGGRALPATGHRSLGAFAAFAAAALGQQRLAAAAEVARAIAEADRMRTSLLARPIKVRTPAPGFSTDSDAREEAGFKTGSPPQSPAHPAVSGIRSAAPPGGSDLSPAPRRTVSDFRARATPPPGTYGFSGLRMTVQGGACWSNGLLGARRRLVMDRGTRRCMRLAMRLRTWPGPGWSPRSVTSLTTPFRGGFAADYKHAPSPFIRP